MVVTVAQQIFQAVEMATGIVQIATGQRALYQQRQAL